MENVLTEISHFYGVSAWYCLSGILCTIVVGVALAIILGQRPNFLQFLLFVFAIFLSGWLAFLSWTAILFGLKAVWDGFQTQKK
ncbi:MAG: hypothetical protein NTW98_02795 [Candidatus Nomurabacteria bacterium]|nr:hypothetical protein [Candidatus Nomurabacteria bacterium]